MWRGGALQEKLPKATGTANVRMFAMGAKEALVDPCCMTGTFPINNTYATLLFDLSPDNRFINNDKI